MKSLKGAFKAAVIGMLTMLSLSAFLGYTSFARWKKSELLAAHSRDAVKLTGELLLLASESEFTLRAIQQWQLTMSRIQHNLDKAPYSQATYKPQKLLLWCEEVFNMLVAAESSYSKEVYYTSLTTVVLNLASTVRVLHIEEAVYARDAAMKNAVTNLAFLGLASLIFMAFTGIFLKRHLIMPIQKINIFADDYGSGNQQARAPNFSIAEVDILAQTLNRAAAQIQTMTKNLNSEVAQRKIAEEDALSRMHEKEILLRETHHRIKNNFGSIIALLSLQADAAENSHSASALREAAGKVESMHKLYETMLINETYAELDAAPYLDAITDSVIMLFPAGSTITLHKSFETIVISPKQLFSLGMIVNELLTNAVKYAFSSTPAGEIHVSLKHTEETCVLTISDNGCGFSPGQQQKSGSGFGLSLVEMLAEQLKGNLHLESTSGTCAVIEFPITTRKKDKLL